VDTQAALLEQLRNLACGGGSDPTESGASGLLEPRVAALVGIAGAISVNAPHSVYRGLVDRALSAGARPEEVLGVLIAVAPVVGSARVTFAAPRLAWGLGYDVDEAFEVP
jgi:alkylhydroperoxidase/carboxymuconolactone decarboxylase family protein YurZ